MDDPLGELLARDELEHRPSLEDEPEVQRNISMLMLREPRDDDEAEEKRFWERDCARPMDPRVERIYLMSDAMRFNEEKRKNPTPKKKKPGRRSVNPSRSSLSMVSLRQRLPRWIFFHRMTKKTLTLITVVLFQKREGRVWVETSKDSPSRGVILFGTWGSIVTFHLSIMEKTTIPMMTILMTLTIFARNVT